MVVWTFKAKFSGGYAQEGTNVFTKSFICSLLSTANHTTYKQTKITRTTAFKEILQTPLVIPFDHKCNLVSPNFLQSSALGQIP
jgi:hypothetical protein